ncbi:hypothetical protein HOR67_gp39 [Ralstonia phage RS-PI-1]|uniref:Uncharacterized protein n=1 Tax=Ralstonia phage RS-PI-1 TaxID=1958965 RepID=A0A1S6L1E1_9CAUD|nr:hypothetical protein HOR67_gp39 [Ralstonia phage RS-PI-1]AQT27801.1 hypothetical protein [Ralstonia phage RS-PI-1]
MNRFENPIVQRTLTPVGGTRPGKAMTRKKDRKARKLGFVNWQHFISTVMANPALAANIHRIAAAITARRLGAQ